MMTFADRLAALGAATLTPLWLPLLAWTALALGVLLVLRRRGHAQEQYAVRTALLWALPLGLLAAAWIELPPLTLWAPPTPVSPAPGPGLPLDALLTVAADEPARTVWEPYLLLGVLTGAAALLAAWRALLLGVQAVRHRRYLARLGVRAAPLALQSRADALAAAMRLRRRVRVRVADGPAVPMVYGWLRPTVVLPASLMATPEALHLTLCHELTHVRRGDFARQVAECMLTVLFAINPLVILLERSIRFYREAACDADVLAESSVDGRRYASLLLHFATVASPRRTPALRMSIPPHQLKRRIEAMNRYTHPPLSSRRRLVLAGGLLVSLALVVAACADLVGPDAAKPSARQDASAPPEVFVVVEEMPKLEGGLEAIQQALRYPALAKQAGIEGRVIVQFVVDEDGGVVDPVVVRGIGGGADEEALRVVREARFTPGRQRGEAVKVKMSLPITFKLAEEVGASGGQAMREGLEFMLLRRTEEALYGRLVVAETGAPAVGANIRTKDGSAGATTGPGGEFMLRVPLDASVFEVSFVGHPRMDLHVSNRIFEGTEAAASGDLGAVMEDGRLKDRLVRVLEKYEVTIASLEINKKENTLCIVPSRTLPVSSTAALERELQERVPEMTIRVPCARNG
ncbi:MAG: TonB family protein [Rhodothermales bacterium]|nr:TonB family protein [Rhodothermales bacterium]